jgi:hypothetical protein
MIRKNKTQAKDTIFLRVAEIMVNNRVVSRGDLIKITGEHGKKFKFHSLVTNTKSGAQWIDCFEIEKNMVSGWRSFESDRIKLIPIKRGRRNVDRRKPD